MPRTAAAVLLLLAPAVARADAAWFSYPGDRPVRMDHVFTTEQDHPDYDFYLVGSGETPALHLPITPSRPVRLSGSDRRGRYTMVAVPKSLLPPPAGSPPPSAWFDGREGTVWLGYVKSGTSLPFTDDRDRVEITHRVGTGADGRPRLEEGARNAGNPSVGRGWAAAAALSTVGIVGLGVWLVRRYRPRRRR